MQIDTEVLKAIAVCAELTGTTLSEPAARIFAADLAAYPVVSVLRALERCRRELRGRLTLADVLDRITESDGRLSADEAWALAPKNEYATAVITDEIMGALAVAHDLIDAGDMTAARMAFRAAYDRLVSEARQALKPVKWWPSMGRDVGAREAPLKAAADLGRIGRDQVRKLLPHREPMVQEMRQITGLRTVDPREAVADARLALSGK